MGVDAKCLPEIDFGELLLFQSVMIAILNEKFPNLEMCPKFGMVRLNNILTVICCYFVVLIQEK